MPPEIKNMKRQIEFKRCLVCSTEHLTYEDNLLLSKATSENWVFGYDYGFVIDLWKRHHFVLHAKRFGLSKDFRKFIFTLIKKYEIEMIQFDCDADIIEGVKLHKSDYW